MITSDLGAELATALRDAIDARELPQEAAALTTSGTWRPAPTNATPPAPGTYATSLPIRLARLAARDPVAVAGLLAGPVGAVPWVSAARVTGPGYLTITVRTDRLTALAARIVAAGQAATASDALAGTRLTATGEPDLTAARSWEQAWRSQREALVGTMARAAGAEVRRLDFERAPTAASTTRADEGPVSAAVAYRGADQVRYVLARTASPNREAIERQLTVHLDLQNPFVAVRYAHSDAAAALRWAGELGVTPGGPAWPASGPAPTTQPAELALLDALSWLSERVAAAARRRRPAELAAHLETLAGAWLDCRESCPALPFSGRNAPADPAGEVAVARLVLADALRTAIAAGLRLLGVAAPIRM